MQDVQFIASLRPNYQQGGSLKCPRCGCLNTKFCYYNNYNLSQPRFFCKGCRRYWTKGGVLRNVPVGGGKRSKQKNRDRKSTGLKNSSTEAANVLLEMKPIEVAPKLIEPPVLCSTNKNQLFSGIGEVRSLMDSSIGFNSAPEWSLFDQMYWLNNPDDHQINYFH